MIFVTLTVQEKKLKLSCYFSLKAFITSQHLFVLFFFSFHGTQIEKTWNNSEYKCMRKHNLQVSLLDKASQYLAHQTLKFEIIQKMFLLWAVAPSH